MIFVVKRLLQVVLAQVIAVNETKRGTHHKIDAYLWRDAENCFRIEVQRLLVKQTVLTCLK